MSDEQLSVGGGVERHAARSFALTLALTYAIFGVLWVFLSDKVLGWLVQDADLLMLASTLKGWAFVFLSALLIFVAAVRFQASGGTSADDHGWRARIPWAILGLMAVAVVGFSLVHVVQAWKQEHAHLERALQTTGVGAAERLADWHAERLHAAQQVEHRVLLPELWRDYAHNPSPERLGRVIHAMSIYLHSSDVVGVALFDHPQNNSLWYSGSTLSAAGAGKVAAGLARAQAESQAVWVGPWRDHGDPRVHLAYIGRLAPTDAKPAWVVMHVQAPPHFLEALGQWRTLEPSGQARWVSASDGALATWMAQPDGSAAAVAPGTAAWMQEVVVNRQPTGVSHLFRDTEQVGMLLPVRGSDWYVLLQADTRTLWANVLRRGGLVTLAGLVGLFSAFAVSYLLLQRRALATAEQALERLRSSRADLASSEARYRLLADNAADVVWLFDLASDRLVYVSPSVEKLTGYAPADTLSRPLEELLTAESAAHLRGLLAEAVQRFNSRP